MPKLKRWGKGERPGQRRHEGSRRGLKLKKRNENWRQKKHLQDRGEAKAPRPPGAAALLLVAPRSPRAAVSCRAPLRWPGGDREKDHQAAAAAAGGEPGLRPKRVARAPSTVQLRPGLARSRPPVAVPAHPRLIGCWGSGRGLIEMQARGCSR